MLREATTYCLALVVGALIAPVAASAANLDEFKIKREQVFEFTRKPKVTRNRDRITIRFASKGYCDATVAIENAEGRIVRHLACGILGPNAPAPFEKGSKTQAVVWDGKDDQGTYVDDKDSMTVRVSLGLKPQFERTLFWSPKKRVGPHSPIPCAAPEGVYVYDGHAVEHIRLFDHDGKYVRTIYPFPARQVPNVVGLRMHTFPHSGQTLPLKGGFHQTGLLTSGDTGQLRVGSYHEGFAANALAARNGRIAPMRFRLNRLAADGSTGGKKLGGPEIYLPVRRHEGYGRYVDAHIAPRSAAFSPDGKWLYMTGFGWDNGWYGGGPEWLHVVTRMKFDGDTRPEIFVGATGQRKAGSGDKQFRVPTSVDVDSKGRVYVSDYINDRIQVFTPDAKLFKTIKARRPAHVAVHQRTGDIYVFSWLFRSRADRTVGRVRPNLVHLGPLENPRRIAAYPLPFRVTDRVSGFDRYGGFQVRIALDSWTDPPTIWVVPSHGAELLLLVGRDGGLQVKRNFASDVRRAVIRNRPPALWRQRLYVNPANGLLYVAEADAGVGKSFKQLVEIDPETGRIRLVELPFDAEDICFDINGLAYLRTGRLVVRYDPRTWREVPWDYGEERPSVGFGSSRAGRRAATIAALPTPGHRSHSFWHLGGIDVSARGHLVVTTCNGANPGIRAPGGEKGQFKYTGRPYAPRIYPGRARWGEIHVYDRHGQVVYQDVFPGMGHMDGVGIDQHDNIYMMAAAHRIINGRHYDPKLIDDLSETLVKVGPKKAKVLSTGRTPVPLPRAARPRRSLDISGSTMGPAWIEGADWFYGGLGFAGKNASWAGGGCCCWNARFDLDYFGRSFAPELRHFSVAVLDTNGNLILRVGRYGNVDDGRPLTLAGGPPSARSIAGDGGKARRSGGNDEVALFHAAYVTTHTDRRLFIADAGNARILSVRLGYHASETVPLRDVPDGAEPGE